MSKEPGGIPNTAKDHQNVLQIAGFRGADQVKDPHDKVTASERPVFTHRRG
jgi:hypothetical protein